MEEKSPRSSAFRQAPCCYNIKLGQRLHAAVSTNNGAMGNEEAASKRLYGEFPRHYRPDSPISGGNGERIIAALIYSNSRSRRRRSQNNTHTKTLPN